MKTSKKTKVMNKIISFKVKKWLWAQLPVCLFVLFPVVTSSCEGDITDFLDKEPSNELTGAETFSDWATMEQFHWDTYNFLRNGECRINGSWMDATTDLAETSYATAGARTTFNIGNYYGDGASNELTGSWEHLYRAIRKCNMMLERLNLVPQPTDISQSDYEKKLKYYEGENRFLRAYFYWELFLRYGAVPIVKEVLNPDGDLLSNYTTRPTVKEYVVDFIIPELQAAEELVMPKSESMETGNQGRVNKPTCRALLTRVYLYMASERFAAESGITWTEAANVAKSFIDDYGSEYELYTAAGSPGDNYTNAILLNAHTENNPEVIFYRSDVSQGWNSYGYYLDAPVGEGGSGGNCPSQNLVDMYDMSNGQSPFTDYDETGAPVYDPVTLQPAINAASGYNDANPMSNRDPRLVATVLFHGQTWNGRSLNMVIGQADNPIGNANATPTGYYMRKYMPEVILQNNHSGNSYRNWIIARYAEILLNYAEALNEAQGPCTEVFDALQQLRNRVGMTAPLSARADLQTKESLRNFIRKERTVELAFEDHRAWDVRRWNVADKALSRDIYGVDVTISRGATVYTRKVAQHRVFDNRMYLYPIPEGEVWKTSIVNNPGWE